MFQEALMALKDVFAAVIFAAFLAAGAAMADGYKPDEFLSLDLSKAALSPKLLGPPAQFQPVPIEAKADKVAHVRAAPKAAPKIRVARVRAEKPHAARTRLAHRHTNPLDAQAFDTRIQVWPCRSGGICNWQRPAQGE
jgi:hypothetical protein